MKNSLQDLTNHLFETIEALKDTENPMDVDRAKAVSMVASQVIAVGKLELQYLDLAGTPLKTTLSPNQEPRKLSPVR